MKISKCKKELARIISEHGGWRAGAESAAQCKSDNAVSFYRDIPDRYGDRWWGEHLDGLDISKDKLIANWHQSCLSRAEYFHLYPAQDAKPEFCESVMRTIPEPEAKPTIEQLAADYRNAKDYAERKQQEADDARYDADAKLKALELAGEALGLLVSPITAKQDPELVITDWRDLQLNDIIEYVDGSIKDKIWMTGPVVEFDQDATDGMMVRMKCDNGPRKGRFGWPMKWRFIRRP